MSKENLNYERFRTELQQSLYCRLPAGTELDIFPVLKNNSLHLDSLVIYQTGSQVSPNFYLQEYYEEYRSGKSVEELSEEIVLCWENSMNAKWKKEMDLSYENCRGQIIFRLVCAKRNQELLEEIPYIPFFDLAVTFYCLVSQDEEGIGSIRISNQLMEKWGVTTRILMEEASQNTPRMFPARCEPISRMLEQMLFRTEESVDERKGEPASEPYILTNRSGINGAAVWLYPGLLEEKAQYFGCSLYILPSSIHELLILADDSRIEEEALIAMVRQVNADCVNAEEFLSDNIYYYDREKKAICMISGDSSE